MDAYNFNVSSYSLLGYLSCYEKRLRLLGSVRGGAGWGGMRLGKGEVARASSLENIIGVRN